MNFYTYIHLCNACSLKSSYRTLPVVQTLRVKGGKVSGQYELMKID